MSYPFKYDVLLDYCPKDKEIVRELAERLQRDGLRVWFDEWEIKPGDFIPDAIWNATGISRVRLLFISSNSSALELAELERLISKLESTSSTNQLTIPVIIDNAKLPEHLSHIKALYWNEALRETTYQMLLDLCKSPAIREANVYGSITTKATAEPGKTEVVYGSHAGCITGIAWNSQGDRALTSSSDATLRLWDVESGNCLLVLKGHSLGVTSVVWPANGLEAVSGSEDRNIRVWDLKRGISKRTLHGHSSSVTSLGWSETTSLLISGSDDTTLRLWDVDKDRCIQVFHGHTSCVSSVTFTNDGKCVLSGSHDNTLRLWSVETGECVRSFIGHSSYVTCASISTYGKRILSSSIDGTVRLWDIDTGQCLEIFRTGDEAVSSVRWSPDDRLAVLGLDRQTIQLWDIDARQRIRTLQEHNDHVTTAEWSPNGRQVLSGSQDAAIRLWDAHTGECLRVFGSVNGNPNKSTQATRSASSLFQPTYSAFCPDRADFKCQGSQTLLDDSLGVKVHANHLAQLISATDTQLPLSIGLFGAWGAGKSYFMDLIEERISNICSQQTKCFHKDIVQIRFNAWHYLDANLWASLTCELFSQLFSHLSRIQTPEEQIEHLKDELAKNSLLAEEAKVALEAAVKAREEADEKLQQAIIARTSAEFNVNDLLDNLSSFLNKDEKVKQIIDDTTNELGLGKISTSYIELTQRAKELRTLGGRIRSVGFSIFTSKWNWKQYVLLGLTLVLPVLITFISRMEIPFLKDILKDTALAISQVTATITSISAWVFSRIQEGNKLVERFEQSYKEVKEARTSRMDDKEVTDQKLRFESAKRQEDLARKALEEIKQRIVSIEAEKAELAPERQLAQFLKSRVETDDYRTYLGLLSVVRRDFEQLSNLLSQSSETTNVNEKLPKIERIVLYIDDLDRCKPQRVVEVLEAVHLLLAFPLFAVVVAVDPRWLRQSLLEHYPRLLGGYTESEAIQNHRKVGLQATPQDYLEKIFQVPFNLEPIGIEAYSALVNKLFPLGKEDQHSTDVPMAIHMESEGFEDDGLRSRTASVPDRLETQEALDDSSLSEYQSSNSEFGRSESISQDQEITDRRETLNTRIDPERLSLTREEVDDVHRFHALFLTPRAVKRLANTYCLIRVGVSENEWDEYLGDEQHRGTYRVPLLMLAVTSACPSIGRQWLQWMRETKPKQWTLSETNITALTEKFRDTVTHEEWVLLSDSIKILDLKDWVKPTPDLLDHWIPRVSRFSF